MKRIFQNNVGKIDRLINLKLKSFKCLYDIDFPQNLILFWFESIEKNFFRGFLDSNCCYIDEYENDQSMDDIDETEFKNYDDFVNNKCVIDAKVFINNFLEILFEITFNDRSKIRFSCNDTEELIIKFSNEKKVNKI